MRQCGLGLAVDPNSPHLVLPSASDLRLSLLVASRMGMQAKEKEQEKKKRYRLTGRSDEKLQLQQRQEWK